jgi:hypothetical protein
MVSLDGRLQHDETAAQLEWLEVRRSERKAKIDPKLDAAMLRVGAGYGFVVQGARERFVITAAHCLPHIPPCDVRFGYYDEKFYDALVTGRGENRRVAAECVFADPLADVAVLGVPCSHAHGPPGEEFAKLTHTAIPLLISDPRLPTLGWMPTPDGRWLRCIMKQEREQLLLSDLDKSLKEMAGAPIVADDSSVIGVHCANPERKFEYEPFHPRLASALPGWLLRELGVGS